MKPGVRCHYWGETRGLVNLGDLLVPLLLDALGYRALPRSASDAEVINPGRCLLVVGSLLTERDVLNMNYPLDVWGCGWKGRGTEPSRAHDVRIYAVRGPHSVRMLGLSSDIPVGDPALLVPQLLPQRIIRHDKAVLIPHFSRLALMSAAERIAQSGCDEVLSPLVLRRPLPWSIHTLSPGEIRQLFLRYWRWGIATRDVFSALQRIAGASFVLTGSLHGAILAQAFGVPWACLDDGYLDAPAKWSDWGAYLGVDVETVQNVEQGRSWWKSHGQKGRMRPLDPLLKAFPYVSPL